MNKHLIPSGDSVILLIFSIPILELARTVTLSHRASSLSHKNAEKQNY